MQTNANKYCLLTMNNNSTKATKIYFKNNEIKSKYH